MTGPVFTDSACQADRVVRDLYIEIIDVSACDFTQPSHFIHQYAAGIIVLPIEQRMGDGKG